MPLAEIKVAFDGAKAILQLAKKANQIEIIQQVIELQQQLLEIQEELAALREENTRLKDVSALRERLQPERGVYWMGDGRTEQDGPFCTTCFDVHGKLVRLTYTMRDVVQCGNCENIVSLTALDPSSPPSDESLYLTDWVWEP